MVARGARAGWHDREVQRQAGTAAAIVADSSSCTVVSDMLAWAVHRMKLISLRRSPSVAADGRRRMPGTGLGGYGNRREKEISR